MAEMSDEELRAFVAEVRTLRASNTALHARQASEASSAPERKDSKLTNLMGGYLDD